ncbi:MAG: hypothetical protein UY31_C0073G0009 [Candidatus Wolfebacteria bacterium GW2011_GWE1_48_7]|nr:MAG: hypothetical protein UY31_C0073G0009 [Candidatus Wolfebacteria bacterium GW2011_GWE1_48_7]HAL24683.1 hypothetical protein [Candidatus Wolfebacteria bacterium]HBD17739.1 hypothetical protein [Candidatus Wolfebacteria bacterium]HBN87310.1 hypothetical protein [Candidatus Wolfebacteria bacterium]
MQHMQQHINQLKSDIRQLKKQLSIVEAERTKFQRIAERDFLTDLYNRHGFIREADRFLSQMKSDRKAGQRRKDAVVRNMAIVFIDVDDLKVVNDGLGHKKGDKYLQLVGRALSATVRTIDIVGRWGGDEFVVALINVTNDEALAIARKLHLKIARISLGKGASDFVASASFGLISTDGSRQHPNYGLHDLIEKADKAMYEAKTKKGKGVIVSFSEITE